VPVRPARVRPATSSVRFGAAEAGSWQVLLDPAATPFCLTVLVPDFASIPATD